MGQDRRKIQTKQKQTGILDSTADTDAWEYAAGVEQNAPLSKQVLEILSVHRELRTVHKKRC